MPESQITSDVLMIRPASFCANMQTADSNAFQNTSVTVSGAQQLAVLEFDSLVSALRQAGVRVHVFDDIPEPVTPDALFPNNWVTFHSDGTAVLYPMLAPNRRLERRADILEALGERTGLRLKKSIDLSHREPEQKFLEGTGSLVLDRVHRIAYACLSPRTHLDVLGEFAQLLDYEIVAFDASDQAGMPVYHTNVLLGIGRNFAVVCADAIADSQRLAVLKSLRDSGRTIIEITRDQMNGFAGNILELANTNGDSIVAMSAQAKQAFTVRQREQLETLAGPLIAVPIPTIETLGGGSVRCMLAELHLPIASDC